MEINLTNKDINAKIMTHLFSETRKGAPVIALQGGRRSGKTYTVMQFLLIQCYNEGDSCIIASMTQDQGKAGAYDDAKTILRSESFGWMNKFTNILKSPREINFKFSRGSKQGSMSFRSFADPETAKAHRG